jgi:hypothetical protein
MPDDVVSKVTDTVKKPVSWARGNPLAFALLIVVAGFVFLRLSAKNQGDLATKAATGSGMWKRVAKLAGVAVVLAVGFFSLRAMAHGNILEALPMLAVTAFPLSDYVGLKDENGLVISKLTPDAGLVSRDFKFQAPREVYAGFPLRCRSVNFALTTVVTQAQSTCEPIAWDKLAAMCSGLDVRSPRFGMLCKKEDSTGPVLKHFDEFIANAYDYSGDEVIADISDTAGTYTVTVHFSYQFEQRWADNPAEFEMFVGWLQGSVFTFWLNKATVLADLGSVGCTIAGTDAKLRAGFRFTTGAVQGDVRGAYHVPPLVNRRIFKKPAAGQIDIPFEGIGVSGPDNTNAAAGERIVAALLLSNENGLPGPGPVNDILEIGCEAFGIVPTENVDQYLMAKLPHLPRQLANRSILIEEGGVFASTSAGWPWTLDHIAGSGNVMDEEDLMAMPLLLPSVGTKISKLPRFKGNVEVHARRDTPPSSGQHCLFVLSLRDIDPNYATGMLEAAGVTGKTTRATTTNADALVDSGKVKAASLVGIPQVIAGTK